MSGSYETAFLADVADNPDDDAPRLIYADWLDEAGPSPRAEFIRVQCALARLSPDDPERPALWARQTALLATHEAQWRRSLPALPGVVWDDFSRGFVEAATVVTVRRFPDSAPLIFEAAPVRRLRIWDADADSVRRLARSPWLARLRELNLGNNIGLGMEGANALAVSKHLTKLESLLLHNCQLGDAAVLPLARAESMPNLRELYLSGNALNYVASALADPTGPFRLAVLDLRDNTIDDGGAHRIADGGRMADLESLWLTNNRIGAEGSTALALSGRLPRLQQLYLNHNPIGNAGASAFARSTCLPALRELDLRHCGMLDAGGRALAKSHHLESLRLLWLDGNHFSPATIDLLRGRYGQRVRV